MKNGLKIFFLFIGIVLVVLTEFSTACKTQGKTERADMDYASWIRAQKKKFAVLEGDRLTVRFRLKNNGQKAWRSEGENPCLFSYHLLDEAGQVIQYDNERFLLPREVEPKQTIALPLTLKGPLHAGNYILEFDLLREGLSWFADYGSRPLQIELTVLERAWPEEEMELTLEYGKFSKWNTSEDRFNTLYKLIRLTLQKNEVEFDGKTGKISGYSPGMDYPQIWLRDANTILPVSKYFYGTPFLSSWLEEHLSFQRQNGSLEDWVNSRGDSDKNTTETDQESSAVQSAYQIYTLLGPGWLQKSIEGEAVIHRLDRALEFVLRNRFDQTYGLITGAHTADWGDVDMVDTDDRAVDVDERTQWTADIYDQSMFHLAAVQMAEMWGELGERNRASHWQEKADSIKQNTNRWLWQEDKGFYSIHLHLDTVHHEFDEQEIFAMGGNVLAVLSGLADEKKTAGIIANALERQVLYKVSTVSGTLLPPYPENFFKHPLLDSPFEYQNGAQWDWFGGRLVQAMFRHGFSRQAKEKLLEIVSKNIANRGFFEWDDRRGTGRGSDFFCGSAGSLGQALIEGYFGIRMTKENLVLEPRLFRDSCRVHIYIPASDSFVAYEYRFLPEEEKVILSYNSNAEKKGFIKILSPWLSSNSLSVQRDGQSTSFSVSTMNQDTYIIVETDFKDHTLEIENKDYFRPIE